ncbi:MAG: hypothetical protein KTR30_06795 [Saprospiraceae bacterium]|nr:hypothetical protein [Saprospiraceae bacterium]
MKDWKPIKSVLLFLLLYPIVLGANIREELGAIIKATTNKGEGILAKVDTVFTKKWKSKGLKFRWHRSIKGANDYKLLDEKWGTFHVFDIAATPGIWYEYKVEVKGKGSAIFFLSSTSPVVGYRPPSSGKAIAAAFKMAAPYQYKGEIYIDFDFKDENGGWVLPDSAVYHIQYDAELDKGWVFDLGNGSIKTQYGELETTQSRIKIKKLAGLKKMEICIRMIQNGRLSRFFCTSLDLRKLPNKRPTDMALLGPAQPILEQGTSGKTLSLPKRNHKNDPFKEERRLAKLVPFSKAAIRRQSQKQRLFRRVS